MKKTILAANFAANKHRDQRRKDREASPYINHPLALAFVLTNEVDGITDEDVIAAAILHDTIEDTKTSTSEITNLFGENVLRIVMELTDDKSLPKATRKQLQIDHASHLSREAKLVKLADKICNLRDMAYSPPFDWLLERQQEYFEWAKAVVDGLRGTHVELEALFDQAYSLKPKS
ncbi:MAG: phosphohydrolase [Gallionellales bacterium 35-53-114]|jgi:guanosine-3',5'-bis(diphosphate) 3'-pyrophosphohydrolase|nr:MAG: phosphohydrolase [Gallionellales bacterium 35-53-114]OYZ62895.1 MAG: phosphohydrolase [Gallionellales bacterium 24-53-125]OZB09972.1 MAG: phosphohydrolase [Gallionellales bacterium 39-52-133]HQS58355.1 HD domain-containing protein [Gallionellaceae bacterium]HQS73910.1 HD domain-containing protein [Gallionellaceae bacterium]